MNVYLDDLRTAPDSWIQTYTVEQTQELLLRHPNEVEHMSLDHDLGLEPSCEKCRDDTNCEVDLGDIEADCRCVCHRLRKTGYDLVLWMAERQIWPLYKPYVHSANPAGAANMRAVIERYWHPPEDKHDE